MKKFLVLLVVVSALLAACGNIQTNSANIEHTQQETGIKAIIQNQPVPDLGGWSFERHIVIQTYIARNKGTIATFSYLMTLDGKVIEICPSIGYPIPYSTQLTNPMQISENWQEGWYAHEAGVIGNPEPNGLYPPESAAATFVNCVNPDGSVTPTYFEQDVFALPYRIKSDIQITRVDDKTSFSVQTSK